MAAKKIIIASDHAGFSLKEELEQWLRTEGYEVEDLGTHADASTDYPDYAHALAQKLEQEKDVTGLLMCGSANGVAMTANKHAGVRAAICWSEDIARLARQHNDANVIALPARFIDPQLAKKMVKIFLNTPFEGGRHEKRVKKISSC